MEAGRELDALVAEKVMGLKLVRHGGDLFYKKPGKYHPVELLVPEYSSFVGEAWQVVERMRETWAIELHGRERMWACLVEEGNEVTAHFIATSEAQTAPLAICLAALKAVGVEVR